MDCKRKFKTVLCCIQVISYICDFFVTDFLNLGILSCSDGQTTAVDQVVCLSFCVTFFGLKVLDKLLDKGINKVGIRLVICCYSRGFQDAVVYIVGNSLIILVLGDVSLIQHVIQNTFPPLRIIIRVLDRIVTGRILCDRSNHSTFRKSKI